MGELTLGFQVMDLEGTPGHHLVAYYAEAGGPDHDAMVLLDMLATQRPQPIGSDAAAETETETETEMRDQTR